jgi:hypothetical protein
VRWLDTNISGDYAASIFAVEVCGEWEVDIDIGGRVRGKVGYSASQQKALEEIALNRDLTGRVQKEEREQGGTYGPERRKKRGERDHAVTGPDKKQ